MSGLKKSITNAGYDQEEAYFFKREQELIGQRREQRAKLELIQGNKPEEAKSQQTDQLMSSESGKVKKAA